MTFTMTGGAHPGLRFYLFQLPGVDICLHPDVAGAAEGAFFTNNS